MKKYLPQLFLLLILCYLLFLIRPALLGQLGGTFKAHQLPPDYVKLEKFLDSQKDFSRTLWVPTTQRFGYFSSIHPAISAEDLFHVTSVSGVLTQLKKQETENKIQNAAVKYVIVPYDSEGEIFLKDRKYDNAAYLSTVKTLQNIHYLTEIPGFGRVHLFEVPQAKDHFFLVGTGTLTYKIVNPTKYEITLKHVTKGEKLVFSEEFDKYWLATLANNKKQIASNKQSGNSQPYSGLFNSFTLPESGDYTLIISYTPQKWVGIGLWVSGITLFGLVGFFVCQAFLRK